MELAPNTDFRDAVERSMVAEDISVELMALAKRVQALKGHEHCWCTSAPTPASGWSGWWRQGATCAANASTPGHDDARDALVRGAAVVVILMVNRHVQTSTGIVWDFPRLRGQVPFQVVVLSGILTTAITVAITADEWVWAAGAGVAPVVVLLAGVFYARQSPTDD